MEKALDKQLEEIMNVPGVSGVLCADSKGLCLGTKGVAKRIDAGVVSGIATQAAKLHPDVRETPVISIESDSGSILIKSHDSITTAVYKSPS